jgi:hypothetical protein
MSVLVLLLVLLLPQLALAQSTGNSFPTPNGQIAPGSALLVPTGPITSGQPVVSPPSIANPLAVTCTTCSPSAPSGASSNPVNGTISVTSTFQSLLAQNSSRKGCTFQNQGSHTMYFSIAVSPTMANSVQLPAFGIFYCSGPSNIVITDAIQITGTSGDAFAGEWQ